MIADNIKKLLTCVGITLLLLCICMTIDYAETVNNTAPEPNLTIMEGDYVDLTNGSSNITVSSHDKLHTVKPKKSKPAKEEIPTITITAKPSCGCNYGYYWHTNTFIDYCPYCQRYGVLYNAHKYPARFEQELTCRICSSDWCGCCGKEKYSWSHYYLRKC